MRNYISLQFNYCRVSPFTLRAWVCLCFTGNTSCTFVVWRFFLVLIWVLLYVGIVYFVCVHVCVCSCVCVCVCVEQLGSQITNNHDHSPLINTFSYYASHTLLPPYCMCFQVYINAKLDPVLVCVCVCVCVCARSINKWTFLIGPFLSGLQSSNESAEFLMRKTQTAEICPVKGFSKPLPLCWCVFTCKQKTNKQCWKKRITDIQSIYVLFKVHVAWCQHRRKTLAPSVENLTTSYFCLAATARCF